VEDPTFGPGPEVIPVMLTQLATVKARLEIASSDTTHDDLLTRAIQAVSARFDRECNRTLARTVGATQEFRATDVEIIARCYPLETVAKFELKSSEAEGWLEQASVGYLLRGGCIISLIAPLSLVAPVPPIGAQIARVTYTGGYVMPGTIPTAGQTALPADLESAAVEQVAVWFQQRDKLGLLRYWPSGGIFLAFSQLALLPQVSASLRAYQRWSV
jgi:hypothetical protein